MTASFILTIMMSFIVMFFCRGNWRLFFGKLGLLSFFNRAFFRDDF